MYIAEVTLPVEHNKQTVTSDYLEDIQELLKSEAKSINPDIDFSTDYILGHTASSSGKYINHFAKIYLYDQTLFIDPYEFFNELLQRVKEKSGKDISIHGDVRTDIPDVDTRPCPTCLSKGWVYVANAKNNKVAEDCPACKRQKRVPLDKISEVEKYKELEFFCQGICKTKGNKVAVSEGVANCDTCQTLLEKQEKQVKELEEWKKKHNQIKITGTTTVEMDILQNHEQILKDYQVARFKKSNPLSEK